MTPISPSSFSLSYDRLTKITSVAITTMSLILVAAIHNAIAACLVVFALAIAVAYSPRSYVVAGGKVTVRRLIGSVSFPLTDVREVRRAGPDDFKGSSRLWGSGGLFGYFGLFKSSRLGKYWSYVTDRESAVVVVADSTTLFSPLDTERFIDTVRARLT